MFSDMMDRIKNDAIEHFFRIQLVKDQPPAAARPSARPPMILNRGDGAPSHGQTVHRDLKKVGRNEPCPCGSGKKYKKCHGQ
jgi:preprotein translocase subunit SecA